MADEAEPPLAPQSIELAGQIARGALGKVVEFNTLLHECMRRRLQQDGTADAPPDCDWPQVQAQALRVHQHLEAAALGGNPAASDAYLQFLLSQRSADESVVAAAGSTCAAAGCEYDRRFLAYLASLSPRTPYAEALYKTFIVAH